METITIEQTHYRDIVVKKNEDEVWIIQKAYGPGDIPINVEFEFIPAVIQALGEIAGKGDLPDDDKGRLYLIAASSIRYHEDGTGDIDKATYIERLLKDYIIIKR